MSCTGIGTNEKSVTIQPHTSPQLMKSKGLIHSQISSECKGQKCGHETGWMEWMERMNIAWMNGTNEYSVNEWNERISVNEWNEWIFREWMERLIIPWMNGTIEYSLNEWNDWIFREWMERMNIPWMNGTIEYSLNEWNDWIFREWMERLNIPWMNGTIEYSVNEWNDWIFREWMERLNIPWMNIPRPGRAVSSANTKRSTTLIMSALNFFPILRLSLSLSLSLRTLHAAAGNSKFWSSFHAFCDGGEYQ